MSGEIERKKFWEVGLVDLASGRGSSTSGSRCLLSFRTALACTLFWHLLLEERHSTSPLPLSVKTLQLLRDLVHAVPYSPIHLCVSL